MNPVALSSWHRAALALLLGCSGCTTVADAGALHAALEQLVGCPDLAGGRVGVVVAEANTGAVLVEHDSARGFLPASNMKLLSAAVALTALGPDYSMQTELVARGDVQNGVLQGDLVLRGHGDPTFGEGEAGIRAVAAFVAAVRELGIGKIRGRVLGDGSWLGRETLGSGWQWDYLDEDYAAPFGGLCFAGNVVVVHVRPGDPGPSIRVAPTAGASPSVAVVRGPAGSPTKLAARRALGSGEIVVTGTIAADAREQRLVVAVADPAAFAAAVLTAALREQGIEIEPCEPGTAAPGSERVIASHTSPPLGSICKPMLEHSNNLYAEQVWRVASRVVTGNGSTASAERHSKTVLTSLGVDCKGMVLADGSGLSRRDLVQPRQIARVLVAMHASPHRDAFAAGLPVAGITGTLRSRFPDGPARGHVRAKTGFISRVVCLSGYVQRPDPNAPPLVFSVMLNDFTCDDARAKAAADAFVQRVAAFAGW